MAWPQANGNQVTTNTSGGSSNPDDAPKKGQGFLDFMTGITGSFLQGFGTGLGSGLTGGQGQQSQQTNYQAPEERKTNIVPWIIGGVLVIGGVILIVVLSKKKKKG